MDQEAPQTAEPVTAPDFLNWPMEVVEKVRTGLSFLITEKTEASRQVLKGYVMDQQPAAGQIVPQDGLTLVVSQGVEVPAVVELTFKEAVEKLRKAQLTVGGSGDLFEWRVIDQSPRAGEVVSAGTTVALSLAQRPVVTVAQKAAAKG